MSSADRKIQMEQEIVDLKYCFPNPVHSLHGELPPALKLKNEKIAQVRVLYEKLIDMEYGLPKKQLLQRIKTMLHRLSPKDKRGTAKAHKKLKREEFSMLHDSL
ncbi:MAG: hypothetical protein L0Y74_06325 [candidate division Zixibacteria bacterium]|nr:hypothetical protein [candidate division Zixibacteria bacterium]